MMDKIQKAKSSGLTLKLSYTTISFTGSAGAGKTNFLNLLHKKKFVPYHNSTGVSTSETIISIKRAGVLGSGKESQWIEMNHDTMLAQLNSYLSSIEKMSFSSETQIGLPLFKSKPKVAVENDIAASLTSRGTPLLGKVWNMINLLDTGGQPEFISLFPAIKSSVALTFIILNMKGGAKSLDEPVLVVHSEDGEQSYDPYHLSMTNLDLVKLLMVSSKDSSVKINPPILPNKTEGIEGNNSYQCYVGTHADKASKKDIESIEKKLEIVAHEFKCEKFLWEHENNSILFPVDNTTAGSDKEDPIAELIRSRVHELVEKRDIYDVPITWFILLLQIQKNTLEQNLKFVLYENVIEISQQGGLSKNEREIQSALLFFHMMGILLYYHDVPGMSQYVITDHQWLFDKLTSIVKITFKRAGFDKKAIEEFKHEGILQKSLIHQIKLSTDIPPEYFFQLLTCLKIVAPLTEDSYFMPCVLPSYTSNHNILEDYGSLQYSELLVQFSQCPLPQGFFCCFIVEIFQNLPKNWELPLHSTKKIRHTYSNLITFHTTDTGHAVCLLDKVGYIEVQIRHEGTSPAIHYKVQTILIQALNKVCSHLQLQNKQLLLGFYCQCGRVDEKHLAMLPKQFDSTIKFIKCDYKKSQLTVEQTVWLTQSQIDLNASSLPKSYPKQDTRAKSRPTMKVLHKVVIPRIAAVWSRVADALDYELEYKQVIKKQGHDDPMECCVALLEDWLTSDRGISTKTWSGLIGALKEIRSLTATTEKIIDELTKEGILQGNDD
ncbi:uncharacterized protein [Dysidea avara]|uniref:uncharacterized protein n=1 Tax=Dysidea avara TaxID=196820 RepID=UPI003325FAD6